MQSLLDKAFYFIGKQSGTKERAGKSHNLWNPGNSLG